MRAKLKTITKDNKTGYGLFETLLLIRLNETGVTPRNVAI
jgi:hypothetical protein